MLQSSIDQNGVTEQYLLIGGVPKSATTSLFRYLADHPEICQANRKETYFFAREFDRKKVCTVAETLDAFEGYFAHSNGLAKWRVEATPYTLYAKDATQKIATMLPEAVLLFILRDPIDRLFSDYRMQHQRGHPHAQNKSFKEYVEIQLQSKDSFNPLKAGCYIEYLRPFLNIFGLNKILILYFEELQANSTIEMKKLCQRLDIDAGFFLTYNFKNHNKTMNVRYARLFNMQIGLEPIVAKLRTKFMDNPKVYRAFEKAINSGKSALFHLNSRHSESHEPILAETQAILSDYYQPYNEALSEELGRSLPWKSFKN